MNDVPQTMRAMVLTGHGGLDQYQWREDWPVPSINETDVLIEVAACGLNNTDVNKRTGWYSKTVTEATSGEGYATLDGGPTWSGSGITFPRIQGADAVGEVVAVGSEADPSLMGKRVLVDGWQRDWSDPANLDKARYFGSEMDGGYADYVAVDHRGVVPIESGLSDAELATFQCSYTTAEGMLTRAGVAATDTVLVTGASGGVGGALVQIAKLRGARVIAMASAAKQQQVSELGADRVIDRAPEDLGSTLGDERVSVVADIVGGPYWPKLIDILQRGGRYTCSGAIAGPIVPLDLRTLYLKDLTFTGSTIVPPGTLARVVGYIERGDIRPLLSAVYRLDELREAQQAFIEKKHAGNIVVTMR